MSISKKTLITGVITACSYNTLKPKALPRRAREQDLSSSLLLDLAKQAEPIGEAVCAKSGWRHKGIA